MASRTSAKHAANFVMFSVALQQDAETILFRTRRLLLQLLVAAIQRIDCYCGHTSGTTALADRQFAKLFMSWRCGARQQTSERIRRQIQHVYHGNACIASASVHLDSSNWILPKTWYADWTLQRGCVLTVKLIKLPPNDTWWTVNMTRPIWRT